MQIGLVGAGTMGSGMVGRLVREHEVIVFDRSPAALAEAAAVGAVATESLDALVARLEPPRAVFVMLPPGTATSRTLDELESSLRPDDVVVNGGNAHFRSSMERARSMGRGGIHFVDMGTSGGVGGARRGYALMVGGPETAVRRLAPVFDALTPEPGTGWAHLGESGAGHFAKMVHNQVKHGMERAYAEGLSALRRTPEFDFDLPTVARVWRDGAMARSAILELIHDVLEADPDLGELAAYVADSGASNWTKAHAIDQMVQRGFDRDQLV